MLQVELTFALGFHEHASSSAAQRWEAQAAAPLVRVPLVCGLFSSLLRLFTDDTCHLGWGRLVSPERHGDLGRPAGELGVDAEEVVQGDDFRVWGLDEEVAAWEHIVWVNQGVQGILQVWHCNVGSKLQSLSGCTTHAGIPADPETRYYRLG